MGQDILPFTAVGGSAILKVTPATEIIGEHQQDEQARQHEAIHIDGVSYDLVTVDGTVRLRNIKKEPVVVYITRKTDGEILTASDDGKISREGLELQAVNPHSVIMWEVTVPTGDKELHYAYRRYVRS
jgi:sugar lactone lactonase YvrE